MVFSSSPSAPLVVVTGATGTQGGSVIKHLGLSSLEYRVRALTRDASKPAAQALAKQGVEIFPVELGVGKVEEATKAFKGADVVFANSTVGPNEEAESKVLVDAAKSASVPLYIWSGLPSYTELSSGKYTGAFHFDGKSRVSSYARSTLGSSNVIVVQAPAYLTNFFGAHKPAKQSDGSYIVSLPYDPKAALPWMDTASDFGAYVVAALEKKRKGEEIEEGEVRTGLPKLYSFDDVVQIISEVTGKKVVFQQISKEVYTSRLAAFGLPEPSINAFTDMWFTSSEFGYFGNKKPTPLENLGSKYQLKDAKEWAKEQDWSQVLA